ncbi:MAG: DNA mismatch endonuclease Vsr [Spirochaetes bacterium]|nr:DNA mismatch endonuclease Vsr [Spirochaetota bacterium]
MDHLTKEKRSWNMSRIGSKNTKPEMIIRSALHKKGYRFRLNGIVSRKIYWKGVLPGKPDIVLLKYKTAIFIHGCFWHGHKNCKRSGIPKTNVDYWLKKLDKNKERDKKAVKELKKTGLKVIVIWECNIKKEFDVDSLIKKIVS